MSKATDSPNGAGSEATSAGQGASSLGQMPSSLDTATPGCSQPNCGHNHGAMRSAMEELKLRELSEAAAVEAQQVVDEVNKKRSALDVQLAKQIQIAFGIDITIAEDICMAQNNDAVKCIHFLLTKPPAVF